MPKHRKARGEFVWIRFGEGQDTHPARLVVPMSEVHPNSLRPNADVEIMYTTSLAFATVKKRQIDYPTTTTTTLDDARAGGGDIQSSVSPRRSSLRNSVSPSTNGRTRSSRGSAGGSNKTSAGKKRSRTTQLSSSPIRKKNLHFDGEKADEALKQAEAQRKQNKKKKEKKSSRTTTTTSLNGGTKQPAATDDNDDNEAVERRAKRAKLDNSNNNNNSQGREDDSSSSSVFSYLKWPFEAMYNGVFGGANSS